MFWPNTKAMEEQEMTALLDAGVQVESPAGTTAQEGHQESSEEGEDPEASKRPYQADKDAPQTNSPAAP